MNINLAHPSTDLCGTGTIKDGARVTSPIRAFPETSSFIPCPKWLEDIKLLPPIYHRVIASCTRHYGLDNATIYQIFLSSGLGGGLLRHIWSLTSRTHPGWFTPLELLTALALIGLGQHEKLDLHKTDEYVLIELTLNHLYSLPSPPVPRVNVLSHIDQPKINTAHSTMLSSQNGALISPERLTSPTSQWSSKPNDHSNGDHTSIGHPVLKDSDEEDWADFTSCHPTAAQPVLNPNGPHSTHPISPAFRENVTLGTQESSNCCAYDSSSRKPSNMDDDFGDFQTSRASCTGEFRTQQYASQESQVQTSGEGLSSKPHPNYQISSDLLSGISPAESLQSDWVKCLEPCENLLQRSLDALSVLSNEEDYREFCQSEEGANFMRDVAELYLVVQRIHISAERYGLVSQVLLTKFHSLKQMFQRLKVYAKLPELEKILTDASFDVRPDIISLDALTGHTNTHSSGWCCGVCLCPLKSSCNGQPDFLSGPVVALAGRSYHAPCANLWVNCVQLGLPALLPP